MVRTVSESTIGRQVEKVLDTIPADRYDVGMDWNLIIDELKAAGFTQELIADRVGCSQNAISELRLGYTKQPFYPLGAALIDLHKRKCRKSAKAE